MNAPLPVLFVHGIRTSATMWRHQIATFAAAGQPALAIDLPGHGSRMSEVFTIDSALDAIDGGVQQLGGRVLLVGLSLGGYLAIEYAARHPLNVIGLVAASCSTVPRGIGLRGYRALAAAIKRLPDKGLALNNALARLAIGKPGAADLAAGGVALDVMDATLAAVGTLDPLSALAQYPGKTWLVNGRLDHFRIDEKEFAHANKRTTLIVIPGATHLLSLVKPAEFDKVVLGVAHELEGDHRSVIDSAR